MDNIRSIDNIEEVEIDNTIYKVVDNLKMNDTDYIILISSVDKEDIMCLRAYLNEELTLEKLDDEEELSEVICEYCKKHKIEL